MTIELDFARALIDAGIPVFIAPPDRHTAIGYRLPNGWQQSKPTPLALDGYEPGWAICALGGHGIDFVDVDPRNGGHLAMAKLKADGVWPREYAIVATPSGGTHHYVTGLSVAKCSREGIDLQAGAADGSGRGFVFLPGTRRVSKVDGVERGYVLALDNLEAYVETIDDTSGDALRSWLRAKPSATNAQQHADTDVFVDTKPRIGDVLPAGMQDVMLTSYAASVVIRAQGRFTEDEMVSAVVDYGGGCQPAWGHAGGQTLRAAATDKVRSAFQKFNTPTPIVTGVEKDDSWKPLNWHELWNDDTQDEWLLEPLIAAGRGTVLYSPAKTGKSLLTLEIAASLACGREVMGVRPERPIRTLIIDHENDPKTDTRDRLKKMKFKPDDLANLFVLSYPVMATLDTAEGGRQVLEIAQRYNVELVVIDTVSRAIAGEENDNNTWLQFYRNTGVVLKRHGIAMLRLDHSGKDASKGQRGGSAKTSDVDLVWSLTEVEKDKTYRLDCTHNRMMVHERTITVKRVQVPLHHKVEAHARKASFDAVVNELVRYLDDHDAPLDLSMNEAHRILTAAGGRPGHKRWDAKLGLALIQRNPALKPGQNGLETE